MTTHAHAKFPPVGRHLFAFSSSPLTCIILTYPTAHAWGFGNKNRLLTVYRGQHIFRCFKFVVCKGDLILHQSKKSLFIFMLFINVVNMFKREIETEKCFFLYFSTFLSYIFGLLLIFGVLSILTFRNVMHQEYGFSPLNRINRYSRFLIIL